MQRPPIHNKIELPESIHSIFTIPINLRFELLCYNIGCNLFFFVNWTLHSISHTTSGNPQMS